MTVCRGFWASRLAQRASHGRELKGDREISVEAKPDPDLHYAGHNVDKVCPILIAGARACPKCLQDAGRMQGNHENASGRSGTAKTLRIKRLSPEAARHHQLRKPR